MGRSFLYKGHMYRLISDRSNRRGCKTVMFTGPDGAISKGDIYFSSEEEFHKSCQLVIDNFNKSKAYDLHSDFDTAKHKETYINYLEVVIMPNGKVSYAVPSHQAKLESIACHKFEIDREGLLNMCPRERWLDYNEWLIEVTGCISVWTEFYLGKANSYQLEKLEELKENGIYLGSLKPGYSL